LNIILLSIILINVIRLNVAAFFVSSTILKLFTFPDFGVEEFEALTWKGLELRQKEFSAASKPISHGQAAIA
jgi:hypothetical protein